MTAVSPLHTEAEACFRQALKVARHQLNASRLILRRPQATGFKPAGHHGHRNLLLEAFRGSPGWSSLAAMSGRFVAC